MNKNLIIAVFCSSLLLPTFVHAQDDIYYSEKDEKAEEEAYAKQQAKELSLQDQALVYQELEGRMSDLNLQALHDDYLADGLYC